jgi:ppGpp synthetase/RelA/SpoT-type nucleotidyltranferase
MCPTVSLRAKHDEIVRVYNEHREAFERFHRRVGGIFEARSLAQHVHSVRYRIKDLDHLLEKVERKNAEDKRRPEAEQKGPISAGNLFERVTDIAGVRVLHLHLAQAREIHQVLLKNVEDEELLFVEAPRAYTWDPEALSFFKGMGLEPQVKDSYYTSVHYVVRPNSKVRTACEVQVRTLLEEVWGEVDHTMNYPTPVEDPQCREQIRVLARLVSAGTHLADSIMRRYGKAGTE